MTARWRAPAGLHVASARLPDEGELPSLDGVYQLIRQPGPITGRTFEITFPDPGAQAYAFTFG